jgi:DNA (cytosine-5)-methyltransferase 1
VTAYHFPEVTQLGDITKINVNELEPVDIVCAGSPCQDLSVAGKRAGLEGERSGLFHTAIRLVHELRARTGAPRYFVWENVPGAFSSNKGLDFKAVLEEISQAEISMPPGGKWAPAGMVEWDRGSLAWRVIDAQYWGVPQRRKRIFLVSDFDGRSAGEILFESQSGNWDIEKGNGTR